MSSELPQCIEVSASVSFGATMQVVKFEYNPKFSYTFTRKYTIPEGWTEQDVQDFQKSKSIDLREEVEPLAQAEMDSIMDLRDRIERGEASLS